MEDKKEEQTPKMTETVQSKDPETVQDNQKDKTSQLKKKIKVLEKRYQMIFKYSKTMEDMLTKILESLFSELQTEIFEENTIYEEISKEDSANSFKGEYISKYSKQIYEIFQKMISFFSNQKENYIKVRKDKKLKEQLNEKLENELFEQKEQLRKNTEELVIKENSFNKVSNLLSQKENLIKELENQINSRELAEHNDLIFNLKNIKQENSHEETLKQEISEQTDLIIFLRKKIENLKAAKKVVVLNDEEEQIWIDKSVQTDFKNDVRLLHKNLSSKEGSQDKNIELSIKMIETFNDKTDTSYDKKTISRDREDKIINQFKFLRDVLEKYFEYRINGNNKKEEMALKLILDAMQLDFQKRTKIQNNEGKNKKFFKFF